MAVMVPREDLTEQRLGALEKKVDEGFAGVDEDIRELRGEITGMRKEMSDRFDALNRTLIGAAVALCVALIGSTATLAGIAVL